MLAGTKTSLALRLRSGRFDLAHRCVMSYVTPALRPSPVGRLRAAYLVALGSTALATMAGQCAVHAVIGTMPNDAALIAAADRQETLSQRIARSSVQIVSAIERGDRDAADGSATELRRLAADWSATHDALVSRDPTRGFGGSNPQSIRERLQSLSGIVRSVNDASARLDALASARSAAPNGEAETLAASIASDTDRFLPAMHEAVLAFEAASSSQIATLQRAEVLLMGFTVAVLGAAAAVLIEPTLRRLGRQHDENLRRSAEFERLAEVARRTTNAVVMTDEHRRIVWVNDGFERISGYSLDEVRGRKPGEFLQCEGTDPAVVLAIREACNAHRPFRGELLNRGKSGREYWLDIAIQPQRDAGGRLVGYVAIETEITESVNTRERLRSTFAALAEGIIYVDTSGRIADCNPAAERILGLPREQICGREPRDERWGVVRVDGTELPDDELPASQTLRTGLAVRSFVHGIRTPDGERRWVSVSTEPIRDVDGALRAVVASFADVTAQHEQATRLELLVDGAGLGTWDWHIRTGRVAFNERWAAMLGYSLAEIAPDLSSWERLVHPDDMPRINAILTDHLEGRTPEYRCEHRLLRKDGTWAWVLDSGRVVERDERGGALRAMGVHVDISEAKRIEAELRDATETAETALREMNAIRTALDEHSILSITDRSGRITEVNNGFCRISGYSREELIGQDHRLLNSGVHPRSFWVNIWRTIAAGKAWRGEVCNRNRSGGLYWVDSTIVPYIGADGVIEKYVSIRFDITAQKAAEAKLVAAQAEAQAANAAKSEFLANMSHEIRTPMTAILGFTDLLASDGDVARAPVRRLEYIDTIRRNGEHLLSIINDILDISKIEAGKMTIERRETEPTQLIRDVLTLMDVKAKAKSLDLEARFVTAMPASIESDPLRLRQILVNLVGNAIKFTEHGGVTLEVSCDRDREQFRIDITDTGIGLTPDQQGRLFGAFMQAGASTTRKFGGTGLGLRISKRLAAMLGGDIAVRSAPGEGSTFTLTVGTGSVSSVRWSHPGGAALNLAREATPHLIEGRATVAGLGEGTLRLHGLRILLAEDGPDNQRLISHHLRRAGAEVTIVENGRLAVEAVTCDGTLDGDLATPPRFDLIVSDMQMPEMDGYAAARLLRAKGWSLPIIALTAHAMRGDIDQCLAAGCDGYAAKPIDRDLLIETCATAGNRCEQRRAA